MDLSAKARWQWRHEKGFSPAGGEHVHDMKVHDGHVGRSAAELASPGLWLEDAVKVTHRGGAD